MPVDAFRLGFVPGVTPTKWVRIWQQRHHRPLELHQLDVTAAAQALERGQVDMALLRPPVDPAAISTIPLYSEIPVVVAGKEHALAALTPHEEVQAADLQDETFLVPADDVYPDHHHIPGSILSHRPETTAEAIALVAAGTGLLIVPLSLARLHHRRDLIHRELAGGPPAQVLLAWLTEQYSDETEDFIGIVRGRTVNSTRGRPQHSGGRGYSGTGPLSAERSDSGTQRSGRAKKGAQGKSSRGSGGRKPGVSSRKPGVSSRKPGVSGRKPGVSGRKPGRPGRPRPTRRRRPR